VKQGGGIMHSLSKYKCFMLLFILLFTGCATTGSISAIKKNETTKEDILKIFGEPERKISTSQGEKWEYKFVRFDESYQRVMDLTINFKDDTVNDYSIDVYTEKKGKEKPAGPRPHVKPSFKRRPPFLGR